MRTSLVPRAAVLARPFSTSRWPCSPRPRTSTRPTGSRSRAPTAAPRGGRAPRRERAHVCSSHGQPFSRAHLSTSRWPPSPRTHVSSFHGQPFSCAHLSTSRWPALRRARARGRLGSTGSRFARPFSTSRWPPRARPRARPLVPRAVVLARPLQHLEVAALRRAHARPVPRAVVLARPLQHLEVATLRRVRARPLAPREILRAQRSTPRGLHLRSCSAEETLVRQSTSSAQTLERAQVSALAAAK